MNRVSTYSFGGYPLAKRRVFTKVDVMRARLIYKLLVLFVFALILSLFCIWTRTQVVHVAYQINAIKGVQNEYKTVNRQLQMELSLLKSPKRLEEVAGKKLGMRTPTLTQIIKVK